MPDDEELVRLRAAAARGRQRAQNRVSVSPAAILRLFQQRDAYEAELLRLRPYVPPSVLYPPPSKPRIEI